MQTPRGNRTLAIFLWLLHGCMTVRILIYHSVCYFVTDYAFDFRVVAPRPRIDEFSIRGLGVYYTQHLLIIMRATLTLRIIKTVMCYIESKTIHD